MGGADTGQIVNEAVFPKTSFFRRKGQNFPEYSEAYTACGFRRGWPENLIIGGLYRARAFSGCCCGANPGTIVARTQLSLAIRSNERVSSPGMVGFYP